MRERLACLRVASVGNQHRPKFWSVTSARTLVGELELRMMLSQNPPLRKWKERLLRERQEREGELMSDGQVFAVLIDLVLGVVLFIAVCQLFPIKRYLRELKTLQMQQMGLNVQRTCGKCNTGFFDSAEKRTACPFCCNQANS